MTKPSIQKLRDKLEDCRLPRELTPRQADVLRYVLQCWMSGFIPSIREIGLEHDISSPNGVVCHLDALRRKGYLEEVDNTSLMLSDKALELVL